MENTNLLAEFESTTCSRCGGSGNYSFCYSHGTTCFRCGGKGITYTKRGAAALLHLTALRSKAAKDIAAGDLIFVQGLPGFSCSRFYTVQSVTLITAAEKVAKGNRSYTNGVEVPQRDGIRFECDGTSVETFPDAMMRRGCSKDEKAATLKAALEFQATLTKAGKPTKRRGTVAA